jgi:hypothetical protein
MGNFTVVAQDSVVASDSIEGGDRGEGRIPLIAKDRVLLNDILFMLGDFVGSEQHEEAASRRGRTVFRARCLCDHISPFLVAVAGALRRLSDTGSLEVRLIPGIQATGLSHRRSLESLFEPLLS